MKSLVLALLAAALPLAAQEVPDLDGKLSDKIAATLKQSGAPSASVAVVLGGKLAFVRAFGSATAETRYAVGSISKQFTAAAILLLQEQHKLSLDDNVSKYFPALTRAGDISAQALTDIRQSLAPLGKLQSVTRSSESLRGGMTRRGYRAIFQKKTFQRWGRMASGGFHLGW